MLELLVLALFTSASANVYFDSKCPEVKSVENFNLDSYAKGKWYEVARYPNRVEDESANCGNAEYTLEGNIFKVKNSDVRNKKAFYIEGFGRLAEDAGNTGKIIFTLPYGISGKEKENDFNIMSIDYLIGYYCRYDEELRIRQGYFTIPGRCPDGVGLQENFRLANFYGKWYQAYHYSSDDQHNNNCSTIELLTRPSGIYLNQSRIDLGLFHRFSVGKLDIPTRIEDAASLDLVFAFKNAPRRLKTRRYPFHVLATNYDYYATIYTCEYSPLIDKHYIYVWILSRYPILNDVSKELASKSLKKIGLHSSKLVKDDRSKCIPKYYEDAIVEPTTFRFAVPI